MEKVKLSLCIIKYHTKTYWEVQVQLHIFLTLALHGGEWSDSCPGCFNPRKRVPRIHWIGGWVGPRAVLDAVVKRKKSLHCPCQKSNPSLSACSLTTIKDKILVSSGLKF
jgi:hypothetical protein